MIKPRLKSPKLCLFWSLPFWAALMLDVFLWLTNDIGFHFSETGYLLDHYFPAALPALARMISAPILFTLIDHLLHVKTIIVGAIISAVPILYLNRRPRGAAPTSFPRSRR